MFSPGFIRCNLILNSHDNTLLTKLWLVIRPEQWVLVTALHLHMNYTKPNYPTAIRRAYGRGGGGSPWKSPLLSRAALARHGRFPSEKSCVCHPTCPQPNILSGSVLHGGRTPFCGVSRFCDKAPSSLKSELGFKIPRKLPTVVFSLCLSTAQILTYRCFLLAGYMAISHLRAKQTLNCHALFTVPLAVRIPEASLQCHSLPFFIHL